MVRIISRPPCEDTDMDAVALLARLKGRLLRRPGDMRCRLAAECLEAPALPDAGPAPTPDQLESLAEATYRRLLDEGHPQLANQANRAWTELTLVGDDSRMPSLPGWRPA